MGWREDSPHHMQDDAGNDNGWYEQSVHCSVDMIINISASLLMAPGTTTSLDWDMILTWDTGGHFTIPRSSVVRCFAKFYLYPAFMNFASIDGRWEGRYVLIWESGVRDTVTWRLSELREDASPIDHPHPASKTSSSHPKVIPFFINGFNAANF